MSVASNARWRTGDSRYTRGRGKVGRLLLQEGPSPEPAGCAVRHPWPQTVLLSHRANSTGYLGLQSQPVEKIHWLIQPESRGCGVSRGTRRPGAVACGLGLLRLRPGAGLLRSAAVPTALRSTGLHIRVLRGRWSQLLLRLGGYHHPPRSGAEGGGSQLRGNSAAWNPTGWGADQFAETR